MRRGIGQMPWDSGFPGLSKLHRGWGFEGKA